MHYNDRKEKHVERSQEATRALRVIANRDGFYDDIEKENAMKLIEQHGTADDRSLARKLKNKIK